MYVWLCLGFPLYRGSSDRCGCNYNCPLCAAYLSFASARPSVESFLLHDSTNDTKFNVGQAQCNQISTQRYFWFSTIISMHFWCNSKNVSRHFGFDAYMLRLVWLSASILKLFRFCIFTILCVKHMHMHMHPNIYALCLEVWLARLFAL